MGRLPKRKEEREKSWESNLGISPTSKFCLEMSLGPLDLNQGQASSPPTVRNLTRETKPCVGVWGWPWTRKRMSTRLYTYKRVFRYIYIHISKYPPLFEHYTTSPEERPTLVPVLVNWKKFKEDFCFYEKRWRENSAHWFFFAVKEATAPRGARVAVGAPSPVNHSASQQQVAAALSHVCEHLSFISTHSIHPLARCVLRYRKSLREFKGVILSIKLEVVKGFDHGKQNRHCSCVEFGVWEC